ncbi:MAG: prepilin-type N-terminal cleavage/methylation domain-containing protein [Patescibacteria group bacterium]
MNNTRGFSLIETIIYIGLFALIMGGGLLAVHQLLQASAQVNDKATIQDEESFVLRKIDWALSGASAIFVPSQTTLTVTRYDSNTVDFRLNGTAIEMRESAIGASYIPITTSNVTVNGLTFTYIAPVGSGPEGVTASTTINGLDASTTKYIRK